MQAAEPDDPQDAVVAQQVKPVWLCTSEVSLTAQIAFLKRWLRKRVW